MLSDDEAVSMLGSGNAQKDSDLLLRTAIDKQSKDNVSIIVVVL